MSMRGKRFGMGLAAGVLLGVVVVAMSGGLGASQIPYAPAALNSATSEATATSTTTYSAESTVPATTSQGTSGQNSTLVFSTSVSTITSSTVPSFSAFNAISGLPSSKIAAVAVQNPASNAFLVVPVVVAFLLGAALYRASVKGKGADDKEEPKED
jgi:hypothetical protein